VGYGKTDFFGPVHGRQQGTFLVAGRTGTTLFAGIGHKHLVLTVRAAHPGKAPLQIPAPEESCDRAVNNRTPETVLGLETFFINLPEGLEVPMQ